MTCKNCKCKCKKKLSEKQIDEILKVGIKKELELEIYKDISKFKIMKELLKGDGTIPNYIG